MLSDNLKAILPSKLWRTAERLIIHYRNTGYTVTQLASVHEFNTYRPHIICKKKYETIVIELREKCNIEKHFENFIDKSNANRVAIKIYYAVPEYIDGEETFIGHAQRATLIKLGIGLLVVKDDDITEDIGTISCNRRFALEPGSTLGKYSNKINIIIEDYNRGNCLDAVRDLCEEVEGATVQLALKAAKKGKISATTTEINENEFDWAGLIDGLSLKVWKGNEQTQIIKDKKLRNSLHSFRDKRNLSDHHKTPKQLRDLEQQYPEAMLQGIRLLRELIKLTNQLK